MLHGRRKLPFFGNLAEKATCVDDKTVLFRYTFKNRFSVICLKSVSQRDTAVSSQKKAKIRIGYGQSVPEGMSDYCTPLLPIARES